MYYGNRGASYTKHPSYGWVTTDEVVKLNNLQGDEKAVLIRQIAAKQKDREKQRRKSSR